MDQNRIYSRVLLPFDKDESFQVFGEWTFYRNGAVKLGPVVYTYRTPIHRARFGANLVASRDVSDPQILFIETAFGLVLWFQYRPLFRRWYQLVEVDSPWLYACQERFGTQVAIAAYYVRWAISWVLVGVIQATLVVIGGLALLSLLRLVT
jgi:hypothetical protein